MIKNDNQSLGKMREEYAIFPVHCVSFYKGSKDQVSTRSTPIDKGKKSAKNKRNCPNVFENLS